MTRTSIKKRCTSKNAIIYALCCPIEGVVRYVGKTTAPINTRVSNHMRNVCGNASKRVWIGKLKSNGLKPVVQVLQKLTKQDKWTIEERKWIAFYGIENLFNDNSGGAGGTSKNATYLIDFKQFLYENYSLNTAKNYYSTVSVFLNKNNLDRPRNITIVSISKYINEIENINTKNNIISALKIFYTEIIKQPKKFKSIKYNAI